MNHRPSPRSPESGASHPASETATDDPASLHLTELTLARTAPCVSIYFNRLHEGQAVGSLRLKSQLVETEKLLVASGMIGNHERAKDLLQPVWRLLEIDSFWHGRRPQGALFCAPGFFQQVVTAHPLQDRVAVGRHFELRPLLASSGLHHRFLVVALNHDQVRLFAGTDDGLRPAAVSIPGRDRSHDGDHRSAADLNCKTIGTGNGHGNTVYFGSGAHENQDKDRLDTYYRKVAHAIHQHYAGTPQPIVLAGLAHLVARFRSVAGHLNLFPDAVIANPDVEAMAVATLAELALAAAKPYLEREREQALRRLHDQEQQLPVARELWSIIEAARQGQISTLFINREARIWGTYDETSGRTEIHPSMHVGDEELINIAALITLRHHGAVYEVGHDDLEPGNKAVAVLRFIADHYQSDGIKDKTRS